MREPKRVTAEQALSRLEGLCARAERCEWELREKLRGWKIGAEDAEAIVARLRATRFVDDRRFAQAMVSDAVRFGRRGRLYIRQQLKMKRIREDIAAEALEGIDEETYMDNLRQTVAAKARALNAKTDEAGTPLGKTREGRMKIFRYAVSRGYEPPLVVEAMKRIL